MTSEPDDRYPRDPSNGPDSSPSDDPGEAPGESWPSSPSPPRNDAPGFARPSAWAPQRSAVNPVPDPPSPPPAWTYDPTRAPVDDDEAIGVPAWDDEDWVPPVPAADDPALAEAAAQQRARRNRLMVREVVETLLLAALVFLAVRASFQNFKVDGASMQPTLENGQFLIVNKLVYAEVDVDKLSRFLPFLDADDEDPNEFIFHGPERGDIIVLRDPRDPAKDLIKRVIGVPGDTFEIINGQIAINGFLLDEPYITEPWAGNTPATVIGEGEYFVMGDNRNNSLDSRSFGLIQDDLIIGKTFLSYWPMRDFGLAPNGSPHVTDEPLVRQPEESRSATKP